MAMDWFDQNAPQGAEQPPQSTANGVPQPTAETPAQEYARYVADYHAPDRDQVLADMQARLTNPLPGPAPQPGSNGNTGVTGGGAPAPATTGTGGGRDAFGQAWVASGGRTVTDLQNFVKAHPEYGVTLGGSKGDKVYGPDGNYWADAVISSGINGGMGATWNTDTSGGTSGGSAGPGGFGSFAQPFGQSFNPPATSTPWKPPTLQDIQNDPSYAGFQFTRDQGLKAIDTGAAANGTLLSGGNQKARANYATDLGNTYAQNAFQNSFQGWAANRDLSQQNYQNALTDYTTAYNVFRTDNNDIWGRYNDVSGRGLTAANSATS